jgi:hypothetical protein
VHQLHGDEVAAADAERVAEPSLTDKARGLWRSGAGTASPAETRAQQALLQRLDAAVHSGTSELVALHGLTGSASDDILTQLGREFATERAVDADRASLIGGIVTGALSGLAADLATGGLTFGAGALLGGVAGAFGARKLTQLYNAERGIEGSTVRWSDEFLAGRIEAAVVRYLAVAHYGRGRGEFQAGEPDPRWQQVASAVVAARPGTRQELLAALRLGEPGVAASERILHDLIWQALCDLYPDAARDFQASVRPT